MQDFQRVQKSLTEFVRDPVENAGPAGIESRRLGIYRDLLFKNIEGSLSNSFPVLRSIFSDEPWLQMVRDFMRRHRCQSPYFVDLAEEFLDYLNNERQCASDPEFLPELAYYEWVELALDVAEVELPPARALPDDLLSAPLQVSPLAWPLAFSFPVHLIGSQFQPAEPADTPTCIVVYRNRSDEVKFLESNPVTLRLLELLGADAPTPAAALQRIAEEIGGEPTAIIEHGKALLAQLLELDILYLQVGLKHETQQLPVLYNSGCWVCQPNLRPKACGSALVTNVVTCHKYVAKESLFCHLSSIACRQMHSEGASR